MSLSVLQLAGTVDEPGIARSFVARELVGVAADLCDDAVLLASELVSNVIRHGAAPARLEVTVVDANRLRIAVHDSGAVLPPLSHNPARVDPASTSGRGLLIVAALAQAWGVSTEPGVDGKGVWFELGPLAKR